MKGDLPRAPGTPTTWVYVPAEPSADVILQAIRQGHVCISESPEGAFVELRAGDEFRALSGDALPRPPGKDLAVRLHCQRGAKSQLRLLDQARVLFEKTINDSDEFVDVGLDVNASLYVRAELRAANENMKALTNPIYLVD